MLTKRQALEESIQLWQELAKTGSHYKRSVPGPWKNYLHSCPLCEYAESLYPYNMCSVCPVVWVGFIPGLCCCSGSPYRDWEDCIDDGGRKLAAKRVVKLLQETLDKLGLRN